MRVGTCPTLRRAAPHHDPPGLFLFSGLFLLQKQRQVVEGWSTARTLAFGKTLLLVQREKGGTPFFQGEVVHNKKKMSSTRLKVQLFLTIP